MFASCNCMVRNHNMTAEVKSHLRVAHLNNTLCTLSLGFKFESQIQLQIQGCVLMPCSVTLMFYGQRKN